MKLNFWQWLALVLLVVGLAIWYFESRHPTTAPPNAGGTATTQPVVAK